MSRSLAHRTLAAVSLAGLLAVTACTATPGSRAPVSTGSADTSALGSARPAPPATDVTAVGMVMDVDGDVQLCMGAVAQSYPPQCSGMPLTDWSWEGVEGADAVDGIRWGSYAVTGRFDGDTLTSTSPPIPLALYDPAALVDPTDGKPGSTSQARLLSVQSRLEDQWGATGGYVGSVIDHGRLWVDVLWDDGTLQKAADHEFGEDVVVIRSALRTAG